MAKKKLYQVELTSSQLDLLEMALMMRANYIETGNVALSAVDAQSQKKPYRPLTMNQMKTVVRIRELADKLNQVRFHA